MVRQPVHGLMTMVVQIFLHFFQKYDHICSQKIILFVFAVVNIGQMVIMVGQPVQWFDDNGSQNILLFLYSRFKLA